MFVHPSVCLSETGVHYDRTVHVGTAWKKDGMWVCKLGEISQERLKIEVKLLISANKKSYMPRRLAQQRMTVSDLEWPCYLCGGQALVFLPRRSAT